MLLKLLKYDFRAMWKQFSLVWGAALVLALVNRFTLQGRHKLPLAGENTSSLIALAFGSVLVAMFVIAVLFVVQRFSRGLLGNEGYLMHTLPVRPWQLVVSKLICGAVTWVGCGVVAVLSFFLMVPFNWRQLLQSPFWSDILQGILKHPDTVSLILEFCLMVLSAIIQSIAVIYLALAIGHLFPRHRKLAGTAAFIGLYILLVNVYDRVFSARLTRLLLDVTTSNTHGSLLTATATMLLPAAVFLAAVCWILENKLNLE